MSIEKENELRKLLNKEYSIYGIKSIFAGLCVAVRDFNGECGTPVEFIERESRGLAAWERCWKSTEMDITILDCSW